MWWSLLLLVPVLAFTGPRDNGTTTTGPEERWWNVSLNHMMAANTDTFPMRFFYNQLSASAVNVVILVGGDWEISAEEAAEGLAVDIANDLNANLFYTEHRYYGQSLPYPDTEVSHLRFLTVDQVLGDLAQFIRHIRSNEFENGRYQSARVVLVGCSLGGSLATWSRRVHPHLVQAVLSDGGPIYALEKLPDFLDTVTEVLRVKGSEQCVEHIKQGVDEISAAITNSVGLGQVSQIFNTCTPLATTSMDVASFWSAIIDQFVDLVWNDVQDVPAACAELTSPANVSPMQRLATWVTQRLSSCLETRYTQIVSALANTTLESPHLNARLQLFQSCSTYGWVRSTAGSRHPFPSTARPSQYYQQLCMDVFSDHFDHEFLLSGLSRTNLLLGGSVIPDYVVSVVGRLDPYSAAAALFEGFKSPLYRPDSTRCSSLSSLAASPDEDNRQLKVNVMNDIHHLVLRPSSGAARTLSSIFLLISATVALFV